MTEKSTQIIRILLLVALAVLLASAVCVAFLPSAERETELAPVNFREDGSCDRDSSAGQKGVANGINMAEGDPTLLQHSEVVNVVIFICFSDETENTVMPSTLTTSVMDSFNGNSVSLFDYYRTLSYGAFTVRSIAPTRSVAYYVYNDIRSRSYYKCKPDSADRRRKPDRECGRLQRRPGGDRKAFRKVRGVGKRRQQCNPTVRLFVVCFVPR